MKYSFPTLDEVEEVGKFVNKKNDKNIPALQKDSSQWIRTAWDNKMDYEVSWLGIPIIQNPYDIVLMQELIFTLRPDIIVEAGIAHGGSLIFYASMLKLLEKGKVIGIDVDIRKHNRMLLEKHPLISRVTMIEGSSIDLRVIDNVRKKIKDSDVVLVVLDSNHTKGHVLEELRLYKDVVTPGSYIVVFDTFMPKLIGLKGTENFKDNTAMDAVSDFLDEQRGKFSIDKSYNKFFVSSCTDGFLKREK